MKNQMHLILALCLSMTLLLNTGCATTGGSLGLGAAGGALIGAGAGSMAAPGRRGQNRLRNILVGTAIGGILGLGAGFAADRIAKESKEEGYQKGKSEGQKEIESFSNSSDGRSPRLLPPRTDARWVPDQIRGSTFIPGHFEYFIVEGSRWETVR